MKYKIKNFIINYIKEFNKINLDTSNQSETLNQIIDVLKKTQKKNTVHIFGNGGSASIASHFSLDLSNNTDIKCINYNDSSLITCFANDYNYENWISKVIDKYIKKKIV